MATIIVIEDIPAKIRESINDDTLLRLMIEALNSKVTTVAPCLAPEPPTEPSTGKLAEAKLIMIGTIQRWADVGSGGVQTHQQSAGMFSESVTIDTRRRGGWNLRPEEITDLQELCGTAERTGAFMVDQVQPTGTNPYEDRPDLLFQWVFPAPTHPASEL